MVIQKEDYVSLPCICCLDVTHHKQVLETYIEYHHDDHDMVVIIHSCPVCKKATETKFKFFSEGPLKKGTGYQIKGYDKL